MSRIFQGGSTGTGGGGGTGPAGADGNTVLYGATAPSNANGVDGNFYIDDVHWVIYGPKTSGAWPAGASIIGPTGATGASGAAGATGTAGAAGATGATGPTGPAGATGSTGSTGATGAAGTPGSVTYNGSGAPSGGTGIDGDYYFRSNGDVYFKVLGSWGSPVFNLVGPAGATGATGATGAAGTAGSAGATGATGSAGATGPTGATGAAGANGYFLAPTAKTANYTALAGELVIADTTAGTFTVTLPTTPADKTLVAVKIVTLGAGTVLTVACGGSAVFNKSGGSTSGNLVRASQASIYQYQASGDIWYVVSTDPAYGVLQFYGDGSDGNVTISGTTTLARDMYYQDLVVTGTLNTANFRVFVAGTLSGNGTIADNAPSSGTAMTPAATLGAGSAGGVGKIVAGFGNGSALVVALGGSGGNGGAAGANGGGSGSITAPTAASGGVQNLANPAVLVVGRNVATAIYGGGSGGASGGYGAGATGGSVTDGAGGPGAGVIGIYAKTLTFTGVIQAKGANGTVATASVGGGGGGGGGGTLLLVTSSPAQTFTTDFSGGTGAAGNGGGTSGANGSAGAIGKALYGVK